MHECSTNTEEQCNGLVPPTRASYTCARGIHLRTELSTRVGNKKHGGVVPTSQ